MILYSDNEMILPEKKIILPKSEQKDIITSTNIILPKETEEEYNRRQFMLFSLACMGMMVVPTKSKANPLLAGAGFIYSVFQIYQYGKKAYKYGKELIKAFNKVQKLRHIGNVRIPSIGVARHSNYNKIQASRVAEKLSDMIGLGISSNGVHSALQYVSQKPEFWDRTGYAKNNHGQTFMNRAVVHINNKSNKKIERKMQLVLVNEYGNPTDVKQFTVVANAYKSGTFNLSDYFRKLSSTGFRNIEYAIRNNYSDIQIRSNNDKIVVSEFLV